MWTAPMIMLMCMYHVNSTPQNVMAFLYFLSVNSDRGAATKRSYITQKIVLITAGILSMVPQIAILYSRYVGVPLTIIL